MISTRAFSVRVAALLAIGSLALAGCGGGGGTKAVTIVKDGDAIFAIDTPVQGFDPNVRPAAQEARIMRQIFDSLVYLDEGRVVKPWLGTAWKISDDGLTYTFTLRSDVKFHDGTPFNAKAVCFNLDRIKNPATASVYAIGLIGPYQSCGAPDDTTAVVKLATPYAPFLNNLSSPFLGINSPTAAAAAKPEDYILRPVGSGPFRFVSFAPNDRVVLQRFDEYNWAPGNAKHSGLALLKTLTFQIIPDATVRMGSLRTGLVQGAGNVPETEVAAVKQDSRLTFFAQQQSGSPFQLQFNASKAPFNDPAVRRAARQAMDIDSAVKALYFGVYQRAWGPLSPTTFGYDKAVENSFTFDAAAAQTALDAAGWVKGPDGVRVKDGKRLSVRYLEGAPNREKRQDIAKFIESNLKAVGFAVDVVVAQAAPLQTEIQQGNYDIVGLSLVAVDPNALYSIYNPQFAPTPKKLGFDLSHTDDANLTAELAQGQRTLDLAARAKVYASVQQDIIQNARTVGIYVPTYTLALNGMDGLRFDAEGYPIFYDATRTR
jgi:peptide/nickel transport system substrate-binding protein